VNTKLPLNWQWVTPTLQSLAIWEFPSELSRLTWGALSGSWVQKVEPAPPLSLPYICIAVEMQVTAETSYYVEHLLVRRLQVAGWRLV
jgi:hypothetical protein